MRYPRTPTILHSRMKGACVKPQLKLKQLGIDTYKEAILFMRKDCHVCLSEGFEVQARVRIHLGENSIIATLNTISSDLLSSGEASLSTYAWQLLDAQPGDLIGVSHAKPVESMSYVRSKIYGNSLEEDKIISIVSDVTEGRYSDIQISAFLSACAGDRMDLKEIEYLAQAMVSVGDKLTWDSNFIVDKHCVGGLPGNRTTPIVVPIVAEFGLPMPKTSSRAITSPAGTADTMEVFTPVSLNVSKMQKVVAKENGCIVWGGAVSLSPADDILIRVEKALDLDSEGQLVASVLSKKVAAGVSHVLIDIPVGPTAKVRTRERAAMLGHYLQAVGEKLGLHLKIHFSDGSQPVGRGIGPALEAQDIYDVLTQNPEAPVELRQRALELAAEVLEFSNELKTGEGFRIAQETLTSGRAWKKFQAICEAQGGMQEIPKSTHQRPFLSTEKGKVLSIDNRKIAKVAKLAGAPSNKSAGVWLQTQLETAVEKGSPLFTVHAESKGELDYAFEYLLNNRGIIEIGEP